MKVLSITSPDISNGLGCRVTVWVAGCSHRCPGCHNPESWSYNQGKNIEELYDTMTKELNKEWIKGITFSGGDPLDQSEESLNQLYNLCIRIKKEFPTKDIWIWSGDVFEDLVKNKLKVKILNLCDILVDGPFVFEKKDRHIAFRGSTNQRIIDLKKSFNKNDIVELIIK